MRPSRMIASAVLVVGAALAPIGAAAVVPTLAASAYATDPSQWGPGDLIRFPDDRQGVVDPSGRTITIESGAGGAGASWNGVTVGNAAAAGAQKIG